MIAQLTKNILYKPCTGKRDEKGHNAKISFNETEIIPLPCDRKFHF